MWIFWVVHNSDFYVNQDISNKYRQLKEIVEKSEAKIIILDMICFEYFILA